MRRVMRLRYTVRLAGEVVLFAKLNRAWWLIPIVLALLTAILITVVGQAAAPWTMYTLF
jgi:hypothetical protein